MGPPYKPLSSQIRRVPPSPLGPEQGSCHPRGVTVRVPVPAAGVVDIPIVEKEVQGQQQHHKVGELDRRDGLSACPLKSYLGIFGFR